MKALHRKLPCKFELDEINAVSGSSCYVLTLCLFRSVSTREVLRCLMDGFRLIRPESPFAVSNKSSISRAEPDLELPRSINFVRAVCTGCQTRVHLGRGIAGVVSWA